jgi:hypothetical protein
MSSFALIGEERQEEELKNVWQIPLDKDPKTGIDPRKGVKPLDYFITTGEAVIKTEVMIKDTKALLRYAQNLLKKLRKSKEKAVYMETEWREGLLIVKQKNPKKKTNQKNKATNPKKFTCAKCKRIFTQKAALTNHLRKCRKVKTAN